ncbi:sugar ABC transporter substrate-binding protein [Gorillibacterium massiliense]|uniref:sugar ABC transporter substrate-binding protein n=1 Tax=Gorillibacterium massiliense TaxID=1280390 RepID=UPI0004B1ED23|nr:maltose ABC transporter substrate-binding protein [Gorillibacterium massiliense]
MKATKAVAGLTVLTMALSLAACGGSGSKNDATESKAPTTAPTKAAEGTAAPATTAPDTGIQPEAGASLVIWESKDEMAFTTEMAKRFTEKFNVPVKVEEVPPPNQAQKLIQDGPSGLGADVIVIPHDNMPQLALANLILPNEVFADATRADNTEASVIGSSYNGQLLGYPRAAETYVLYYNKDLVKDAPLKTWDDVIAFAKTFTNKSKNKYGIMWEVGNFYFNYPFIASTGGYLFGKDGTDPKDMGLASDGALEGLKVFSSVKEVLPVKSADITPDIKRGLFTSGDVAIDMNGPWELAGYKKALGDKLGVATIPTVAGKTAISFSGIKSWYVNAYSKYPNAAQLFAHFSSSKEAQLLLNEKVGAIPTNLAALEDPQVKSDPIISVFAEQAKNSQPMPTIPEISNVWAPANAAFPEIWDKGSDAKTVMENAIKQIQDLNNGGGKK